MTSYSSIGAVERYSVLISNVLAVCNQQPHQKRVPASSVVAVDHGALSATFPQRAGWCYAHHGMEKNLNIGFGLLIEGMWMGEIVLGNLGARPFSEISATFTHESMQ
jgi:hypothetical protein